MAKQGANKARNQQLGSIDAPWFKNNTAKRRKQRKIAKASKRANRKNR